MEYAQPITRFSLAPLTVPYEEWKGKTQLLCDGAATAFFIEGCDLKAQYQCGDHYLLVTEYDCPYEESVTVTLLNRDFKPIASSTHPQTWYPVVGGPSYFFEKIVWNDARHFELHIEKLPHHFQYSIRDFSIPFLCPRLSKRMVRKA